MAFSVKGRSATRAALRLLSCLALCASFGAAAPAGEQSASAAPDSQSIARGRTLFLIHCASCHGRDGKAQIDLIANATDLTQPRRFKFGTTDAELLATMTKGAGNMPGIGAGIPEGDRAHLVSYIKSLWGASAP